MSDRFTTHDLIRRLQDWRNADQEDAITLPRSHVCMLLEHISDVQRDAKNFCEQMCSTNDRLIEVLEKIDVYRSRIDELEALQAMGRTTEIIRGPDTPNTVHV